MSIESIETYYHHTNRDSLRKDAFKTVDSFDQLGRVVGESYTALGFSGPVEDPSQDSVIYFYDSLDRPTSVIHLYPLGVWSVVEYAYSPGVEIQTTYYTRYDQIEVDVFVLDSLNRVSCSLDYDIGFEGAQDTGIYLREERKYEYDTSGRNRIVSGVSVDRLEPYIQREEIFQFRDGHYIQTQDNQYRIYDTQGYIVEEYWWRSHTVGVVKLFYHYKRNERGLPVEGLLVNAAGEKVSLTRYSYHYYDE